VIILLSWPTLHAQRGLHGHGRAISLTTMFDEQYPMLCDMARGANERVVLNATESNTLVWDHLRQGQLCATGCTTHRSNQSHTHKHPPVLEYRTLASCRMRYHITLPWVAQ
jgi:hypothetical protein